MLYGNDRKAVRQVFFRAWRQHLDGEALEPLQRLIVEVIAMHPEYHTLLERRDDFLDSDFDATSGNPFWHMGMHIGIAEQLQADHPAGIRALYQQLLAQDGDRHAVEHRMMECLGQALWQAQRNGVPPNDRAYLECLRGLLGT